MKYFCLFLCSLSFVLSATLSPVCLGDDWPQWMGPKRDSVWSEEGVLTRFPQNGPKVSWRTPVGMGYGGPAVVDDVVYVMDYVKENGEITENPGVHDELGGHERILAIDAKTGKILWENKYPEKYSISYPSGPRVTPTVQDGVVYTVGAQGETRAIDAKTGKLIWSRNISKDFGVDPPHWGFSSHPLVVGDVVITSAGAPKQGEAAVPAAVGFNKKTGEVVWRALPSKEPGYAPPTVIEHKGVKQVLIYHGEGLNSIDPATGKTHWSVPVKPDHGMAIMAPRKFEDYVYVSGVPREAVLLRLDPKDPVGKPEEVWRADTTREGVFAANVTPFIEHGIIYGVNGLTGSLMAVHMDSGKRLWENVFAATTGQRRAPYGTAFLVKNKDHFYIFNEKGDLIIAKLKPNGEAPNYGYEEIGRFHVLEPSTGSLGREVVWTHPAFSGKSAYIRNGSEIVKVDLDRSSYKPEDFGPTHAHGTDTEDSQVHGEKAKLSDASTHILNMTKYGLLSHYQVKQDPEKANHFNKNDLWTKVSPSSLGEVTAAISFLWGFPEKFSNTRPNAPKPSAFSAATSFLKKLTGGKDEKKTEWSQSEDFLDFIDQHLSKIENKYRDAKVSAKEIKKEEGEFIPTVEKWYPEKSDKDEELWQAFGEMAALEYYFYTLLEVEVDLKPLYEDDPSVRVRDKDSRTPVLDYFSKSANPEKAAGLAKRMAKLLYHHGSYYGTYGPHRELLVRYLSYQWEMHDLLIPEEMAKPKRVLSSLELDRPETHK